ncbi:hypothetical protein [Streptococcus mutans]|uniref:hypothetical protein n=1 Tax=Streptococcus mutans TaxID=1309 RepID=UPI000B540888|nr:hypothetical protein [Streptococcus mutans]NLR27656.1 hypothetical protein [Streptococcus mutans]SUN72594.1 Uncharacterised protein [Streptococcus mutans]
MKQTVQEFIDEYTFDTSANCGIYAIHQTKDECICTLYRKPDGLIEFDWNRDVINGTVYKTQEQLLDAPIAEVIKITKDWLDLIVYLM